MTGAGPRSREALARSEDGLAELSARLGHAFRRPELLEEARTHASAAYERRGSRSNERLEFLGDAVLDLVMAQLLYEAHPDWEEGELTRARAAMVNTDSLAARARELDLGPFIRLGRTEIRSGGADKGRVLANVLEALLGALYLDGGLAPVIALVRRVFGTLLASGDAVLVRDPKTRLQEWTHATLQQTPSYRVVEDRGEEGGEMRFTVEVEVGGESWGRGTGPSKRSAERAAASQALERAQQGAGDG